MMRALLVATVLAGCYNPAYEDCKISCVNGACPSGLQCVGYLCRSSAGTCGGGSGNPDAQLGSWRFRKKITAPSLPFPTVENFPALIYTARDPDLANFAQPSGGDIKFTLMDGTQLSHELERYDRAQGELVAWVKAPVVASGAPTELYMYYGNPMALDQQNRTDVWDASYVGVWHLSDPPGTMLNDATANNHDGVKATANGPAPVPTGQVAGAHNFAGNSTDLFSVSAPGSTLDVPQLTFETWINRRATGTGTFHRVIDFPVSFTNHHAIAYPAEAGVPTANPRSLVLAVSNGTVVNRVQTGPETLPVDTWTHVVVTIDNAGVDAVQVYINGQLQALGGAQVDLAQSNSLVTIGGTQDASQISMDGILDEVRISNVVRSAEYAQLSYLSQSQTSFITFGPAETVP